MESAHPLTLIISNRAIGKRSAVQGRLAVPPRLFRRALLTGGPEAEPEHDDNAKGNRRTGIDPAHAGVSLGTT